MPILRIRREDGAWAEITAIVGSDGKSAYQYAVDGGYTGTEAEFAAKLAQENYAKGEADEKTAAALTEANGYTDEKIALLLNNSSEAVDSIMELATAMEENEDVVAALEAAIGSKAAATDLTAHTEDKNNPHGVTAAHLGLSTESWTFALEDGSTVTKAVYVG